MLLSEVSTFVADRERAAILYDLLSPFEDRNITLFHAASFGCAATYLGKLATLTNRLEQAEKHFERALAVNESMGAIPWLADTQYEYARMLLSRGRDTPDRKRAQALLAEAHSTARQIGYSRLVSLIGNLETKDSYQRDRFTTPAPLSPATRSADDHSCAFYREGEFWTIVYNGHAVRIRHAKGLSYIHKLLTQPNNAIHVFELARQGHRGIRDRTACPILTPLLSLLRTQVRSWIQRRNRLIATGFLSFGQTSRIRSAPGRSPRRSHWKPRRMRLFRYSGVQPVWADAADEPLRYLTGLASPLPKPFGPLYKKSINTIRR